MIWGTPPLQETSIVHIYPSLLMYTYPSISTSILQYFHLSLYLLCKHMRATYTYKYSIPLIGTEQSHQCKQTATKLRKTKQNTYLRYP